MRNHETGITRLILTSASEDEGKPLTCQEPYGLFVLEANVGGKLNAIHIWASTHDQVKLRGSGKLGTRIGRLLEYGPGRRRVEDIADVGDLQELVEGSEERLKLTANLIQPASHVVADAIHNGTPAYDQLDLLAGSDERARGGVLVDHLALERGIRGVAESDDTVEPALLEIDQCVLQVLLTDFGNHDFLGALERYDEGRCRSRRHEKDDADKCVDDDFREAPLRILPIIRKNPPKPLTDSPHYFTVFLRSSATDCAVQEIAGTVEKAFPVGNTTRLKLQTLYGKRTVASLYQNPPPLVYS